MFHCKDFNAKDKCKNPHLICISYDKYDANLNPLFDLLKCDRNLVLWNSATIGLKLSFSEQNIKLSMPTLFCNCSMIRMVGEKKIELTENKIRIRSFFALTYKIQENMSEF